MSILALDRRLNIIVPGTRCVPIHRRTIRVPAVYIMHFVLADRQPFSSGRGSFFARLAAGHAGPRPYITADFGGPVGLRGACAGRSKSRRACSFRGIAFRRANRCVWITPASKLFKRCGSHATTAAALAGIPLVTATVGASACTCLCVCAILNTIWTVPIHSSSEFN